MEWVIDDYADWRNKARALLLTKTPPDKVMLSDAASNLDLFNANDNFDDPSAGGLVKPDENAATVTISRDFLKRAHWVAHHSDQQRWQLLYSLAWRLVNESKQLLADPLDEEVARFNRHFKAVTRDYHKMKAFVRFQDIASFTGLDKTYRTSHVEEPERLHQDKRLKNKKREAVGVSNVEAEHFIAWFEPEHFVLPLAAQFFSKRFSSMNWSVLTPHECAHFYQKQLIFTSGTVRPPLPEDHTEQLWLQYYGSIFNPSRVKIKAMQSEMPKKYWKNLPEAKIIQSLLRNATRRVSEMTPQAFFEESTPSRFA